MLVRLSLVFLMLFATQTASGAQISQESDAIRNKVELISSGKLQSVDGQEVSSVLVLPALYERRNYAPVWSNQQSVHQLIEVLKHVDEDGLDSSDYHLPTILGMQANNSDQDSEASADSDILMTDALIRLGYHLLAGKVDVEALDAHWNMTKTIGDLDAVLSFEEAIESARIPMLIDHLRPSHPYYDKLRQGLAHYRVIRDQGGWPIIPSGLTLKPGMTDKRISSMRTRLNITGELADADITSDIYDDTLEMAVKRFQENHGLTPDGIVGPATLEAMNVPVQARIDQIKVNLERARWVLHDPMDEVVITDIAGFEVSYRRGGKIIWSARAQVGKPYRKTPVFKGLISYLEVNPTWTVPPTILRNDILPKIARDPGYLQKLDMQVLTQDGKQINPLNIDWSQYPQKPFPYLLRQNPGPKNALGLIKFMFPNKYSIYLHDTPNRNLFDKDQRAFSSGCIRVMHPFELAELLLDDPQWTKEQIKELVESKKTTRINLRKPVAVVLMYWTVNIKDDGSLVFKPDVYGRDAAVLDGLNKPFSFRMSPILND